VRVRTRLLLVISSEPDGPSVRHRWLAYGADLERAGIVVHVAPWPKDDAARHATLVRASNADGVVLSRRLLPRRWARRLRRRARRLAYDVDDAMAWRDSARGATRSFTRARRFARLVRLADRVFVGNAHLAALAKKSRRPPVVLPTAYEVTDGAAPTPRGDPCTIGWIGSAATVPYLEARVPELSALVASGRVIRLRVVADRAPTLPPGIALEHVPWSLAGERDALAGMDVGFAPLPDDPWTRGKCGFKVVQMLGAGRPVVASRVGVQAEQVKHGETGFLGTSPAELLDGLLRLVDDPELRARLGAAAREDARARWSRARWAPDVVAAVEDLLA
jgi:hypothetical protein